MALIQQRQFILNNSHSILIRNPQKKDAQQVLALAKAVLAEEIFNLSTLSEFSVDLQDEIDWFNTYQTKPYSIILVAEYQEQVVGLLDFANGHRQRIAHTGDMGISVAKIYRHLGIGTALLQTLIDWAASTSFIEKINLQVHSTNHNAIKAYLKNGFRIEGVRKNELKYSEQQYIDSILMAYFIRAENKSNRRTE